MFAKNSRYFDLPEVHTLDASGRTTGSTALRFIGERPGEFIHRVHLADRLDLLAYKYYRDPGKWWLIADANTQFAQPAELLQRHPFEEYIFLLDLSTLPLENKWLVLRQTLAKIPGVENFFIDRDAGKLRMVINIMVASPIKITRLIQTQGFVLAEVPKPVSRAGAAIIIPPEQ